MGPFGILALALVEDPLGPVDKPLDKQGLGQIVPDVPLLPPSLGGPDKACRSVFCWSFRTPGSVSGGGVEVEGKGKEKEGCVRGHDRTNGLRISRRLVSDFFWFVAVGYR